jgi:hypothetical protein
MPPGAGAQLQRLQRELSGLWHMLQCMSQKLAPLRRLVDLMPGIDGAADADQSAAEFGCGALAESAQGNSPRARSQIPDLILSHHPARAVARKAAAFR